MQNLIMYRQNYNITLVPYRRGLHSPHPQHTCDCPKDWLFLLFGGSTKQSNALPGVRPNSNKNSIMTNKGIPDLFQNSINFKISTSGTRSPHFFLYVNPLISLILFNHLLILTFIWYINLKNQNIEMYQN